MNGVDAACERQQAASPTFHFHVTVAALYEHALMFWLWTRYCSLYLAFLLGLKLGTKIIKYQNERPSR